MPANHNLTSDVLKFDKPQEVARISHMIRTSLSKELKRRGLIVAISGGVDSAVCAALCVEALGPNKVFGLLLPETDSASESLTLGKMVAEKLGIKYVVEDIAPTLKAIGCYKWRDETIKSIFQDYDETWKNKIIISGGNEGKINFFELVVQSPDGIIMKKRLRINEYLQIVSATNYKQRIRKTVEYFHADRLNYAVVGTPNKLEYDQGFFVKNGDGSADIKPIAHLYKTQVYALAQHLGLPEEICNAVPSTDTYSMPQGQDEFYFTLPYHQMDMALWAINHEIPAEELARFLGISNEQAEYVYRDITAKRKATRYLHLRPQLIDDAPTTYSSIGVDK